MVNCGDSIFCCGDAECCEGSNTFQLNNRTVVAEVKGESNTPTSSSPTPTNAPSKESGGNNSGSNDSGGGLDTGELVGAIVAPVCTLLGTIAVAWLNREKISRYFGEKTPGTQNREGSDQEKGQA